MDLALSQSVDIMEQPTSQRASQSVCLFLAEILINIILIYILNSKFIGAVGATPN